MAAPLAVSWIEIRRAWETSRLGDAALATRFGFASKTTVKRRRLAEGWVRDEAAIEAGVTAEALAVIKAAPGVPGKPPEQPGGTRGAQGRSEQLQRPAARTDVGVPPQTGLMTSASRQPAAHAREGVSVADELQAEAVAAKVRQLRLARKLQDVSDKVLSAIEGVMDGPLLGGGRDLDSLSDGDPFGPSTPYGLALITLRALNPDKDSLSSVLKAATDTLSKGIELERKALNMDGATPDAPGEGELPSGVMSEEEFVAYHAGRLETLEALADATREIARIGAPRGQAAPTIDGQSERVK